MKNLQKKANFTSFFDPSKGEDFSGFLVSGNTGNTSGVEGNSGSVAFRIESGKVDTIKELSPSDGSNSSTSADLVISLKEVPYCDESGETGFILLLCSDPYSKSIAESFQGYNGLSNSDSGGGGGSENPWD